MRSTGAAVHAVSVLHVNLRRPVNAGVSWQEAHSTHADPQMEPFITRPTELADHLAYLSVYAGDLPPEDEITDAQAFAEAFDALNRFIDHTPTDEGKEAVRQCDRNLRIAYEYLENGNLMTCAHTIQETEELFRKARKFISISDE